jgi:hypothetical protein
MHRTIGFDVEFGADFSEKTYVFCISLSGRITPEEKIAPEDFAVP